MADQETLTPRSDLLTPEQIENIRTLADVSQTCQKVILNPKELLLIANTLRYQQMIIDSLETALANEDYPWHWLSPRNDCSQEGR